MQDDLTFRRKTKRRKSPSGNVTTSSSADSESTLAADDKNEKDLNCVDGAAGEESEEKKEGAADAEVRQRAGVDSGNDRLAKEKQPDCSPSQCNNQIVRGRIVSFSCIHCINLTVMYPRLLLGISL